MKYYFKIWQKTYLVFLCLIIFITTFSYSLISLTSSRLQSMLEIKSAEMLGGNKVLYSGEAIKPEIISQAQVFGLKTSLATIFLSMVSNEHEFSLAEIKAVDNEYPLTGQLQVSSQVFGPEHAVSKGPLPGTAWLEPRLMLNLKLKVKDQIRIGESQFHVKEILSYEPDRVGEALLFAPQVLINQADLPAMGILVPGSRIQYKLMLLGNPAALKAFENWLKPQLTNTQELVDIKTARGNLKNIVERMHLFLQILLVVNIFFGVATLFIVSVSFIQTHRTTVAILRSLGLRARQLFTNLFMIILLLAIFSGTLAMISALVIDNHIASSFHAYLAPLELQKRIFLVLNAFIFLIILLSGFLIPTLNKLRSLSPNEVFRKSYDDLKLWSTGTISIVLLLLAAILAMTLGSLLLAIQFLSWGIFVLGLTWLLIIMIFKGFNSISTYYPSYFKLGIKNIIYNMKVNTLQIASIAIALTFGVVFYLVQTQLLKTWQTQIPENAPNYFAINISPRELDAFQKFLSDHQIIYSNLYPIVRARLLSLNNQPIQQNLDYSESQKKGQPTRLLNLTESNILPPDNTIIQGNWFNILHKANLQEPIMPISIEEGFANRISAGLNDQLSFQVGDQTINGTITSIRTVTWDNFQPNFYVIFPRMALTNFPQTYLGSFYLESNKIGLLSDMMKLFPSISLIEIEGIIREVKALLDNLINYLRLFLLFTLSLGLLLFALIISIQAKQNAEQYYLFKILGAGKFYLLKNKLFEYFILAMTAGLIAWFTASLIYYWLSTILLKLPFEINYYTFCFSFFLFILLFICLGLILQKLFQPKTSSFGQSRFKN